MVRGNDGVDKVSSVIDFYLKDVVALKTVSTDSMELAHQSLANCYGFGSFMAGQVVADLRWAKRGSWVDRNFWAPMGPGSQKGMNQLQDRPTEKAIKQVQFEEELQDLTDRVKKEVPEAITSRMEAIDFQNCLCEISKYNRTFWGVGKPKQLYRGGK